MRNITIKDIAKHANVSIGTVSNVLNNKGNIKIETIRKVEKSINELGYIKNMNALSIKTKNSIFIGLIIDELNSVISPLITDLLHVLNSNGYELKVIELSTYNSIADAVNYINSFRFNSIIASYNVLHILKFIPLNSSKLILLGKTTAENINCINFHFKFIDDNFLNTNYNIYTKNDIFSFGEMLRVNENSIIVEDLNDCLKNIDHDKTNNFIAFASQDIDDILEFCTIKDIKIGKILYVTSNIEATYNYNEHVTTYYYSSNELSVKILDIINTSDLKTKHISVNRYSKLVFTKVNDTLNILMLSNPFSIKLKEISKLFTHETGIKLNIKLSDFSEIEDICCSNLVNNYDILRLDVNSFKFYGKDILYDLTKNNFIKDLAIDFNRWEDYIYLDERIFALPADTSVQIMLYRKNIFENAVIEKLFLKKFRKNICDNLTYKELYRFAKYYNQIDVPEKIIPKLIATNVVNPLLVASEFLPYFYSLGGNVSYKNNNINITKQEFLKTYELYKEIHFTSYNSMSEWWNEEIEAFNTGKTSAVICYTSQLANITISDIGFTSIPGSVPSLGGGCIGICKNTKKLNSSLIFLKWLYQYQIQLNFAKHGICVPYNNMYYNREVYKKYPFLAFSNSLHSNSKRTHYAGNGIKVNTISFENLLGTEVLKGINNNLIGEKIYTNLIESLNKHQDTLIKK